MPTLSENRWLRMGALCGLYVAQGIPFGFVTIALVAWLADRGVTTEEIGAVIAMTSLPWTFKFLWGPLIDRYGFPAMGRRRPWILVAQTAMALTLAAMVFVPDLSESVRLVVWLVCLINVFASVQDVAVDALAVDLLKPRERGRANGLMYGCSYGGSAIGGAVIGAIMADAGLRMAIAIQVLMVLAIMLIPLLVRERPGEKLFPWSAGGVSDAVESERAHSLGELAANLAGAFRAKAAWVCAILALASKCAVAVSTTVIVTLTIQKLDWTQEEFTGFQGAVAVWFGLCGSVMGGFLADLVGARRLAMIATAVLGGVWIAFGLTPDAWESRSVVMTMVCLEGLIYGVFAVSLFAIFMGVSWRTVAASQFTAYMAMMNLSNTGGAWCAGKLGLWLSEAQIYLAIGVAQIAVIGILLPVRVASAGSGDGVME